MEGNNKKVVPHIIGVGPASDQSVDGLMLDQKSQFASEE
jgi:hypothetical protein